MKYQLVLQWSASSIYNYDAIVKIEDVLNDGLSDSNKVDGHDAGAGEINIFIHTNDPLSAFDEVKAILGERVDWSDARAAYRDFTKSDYVVLWPKELKIFSVA